MGKSRERGFCPADYNSVQDALYVGSASGAYACRARSRATRLRLVADACRVALYSRKIKQLEKEYLFDAFGTSIMTDAELRAKPMVMLVGQYSTGMPRLRSSAGTGEPRALTRARADNGWLRRRKDDLHQIPSGGRLPRHAHRTGANHRRLLRDHARAWQPVSSGPRAGGAAAASGDERAPSLMLGGGMRVLWCGLGGRGCCRTIPGNTATSDTKKPFRALNAFGGSFLGKFCIAGTAMSRRATAAHSRTTRSGSRQPL
eukprot:scaffold5182_cov376-Prasinococcus_capsulatus_cf.AAC.4